MTIESLANHVRIEVFDRTQRVQLVVTIAVFLLGIALQTVTILLKFSGQATATHSEIVAHYGGVFRILIPLVAIIMTHSTVVGERKSGTIRTLLSVPYTRRTVFFGKFFGRLCVSALSAAIASCVVVVISLQLVQGNWDLFLPFFALSASLLISFVSIAIFYSVICDNRTNALLNSLGVAIFSLFAWQFLVNLGTILFGFPNGAVSILYLMVPTEAYLMLLNAVHSGFDSVLLPVVAMVSLLIWTGVPLILAARKFEQMDI